jgi:hypothetical protein
VKYVFRGNAPQEYEDPDGLLLVDHPLDEREFDEDPGDPWEAVDAPEKAEPPAKAPAGPAVVITPDGPRAPVSEGA